MRGAECGWRGEQKSLFPELTECLKLSASSGENSSVLLPLALASADMFPGLAYRVPTVCTGLAYGVHRPCLWTHSPVDARPSNTDTAGCCVARPALTEERVPDPRTTKVHVRPPHLPGNRYHRLLCLPAPLPLHSAPAHALGPCFFSYVGVCCACVHVHTHTTCHIHTHTPACANTHPAHTRTHTHTHVYMVRAYVDSWCRTRTCHRHVTCVCIPIRSQRVPTDTCVCIPKHSQRTPTTATSTHAYDRASVQCMCVHTYMACGRNTYMCISCSHTCACRRQSRVSTLLLRYYIMNVNTTTIIQGLSLIG